jgi:hypothetical protein
MRSRLKAATVPRARSVLLGAQASSLAEFAIALPLLVVLIVGIFDFAAAFNLKQELNNAAREGVQFAARQPTNDITNGGTPPSVDAVRFLVDSYLLAAKINDCGLGTVSPPGSGASLAWNYTASGNGCPPPGLQLLIERGDRSPEPIAGDPNLTMIYSRVRITYPYQWRFNGVIQLLVPGANYGLTNITTDAVAANTN